MIAPPHCHAQACSSDVGLNGARCFWQVYRYPGVYGDPYPRLHAHSLGLRADRVNGPYDDQTGAFPPVEPHRADVIPEARADLRSELPAACGGLSALQRPRPHVLVSGRQFARSLFLTHFPDESRACTARQVPAARAWVASQVQNGRSAVNAQHAARESRRHGQGQWPRRTARMSWEYTLAWAYRLAADAIDLRGERQP